MADRCAAAVFRLDTYETEAYRDEGLVTGEASGFFITEDGLAVTNYHSIADAVSATATLSTGDVYEVERVIYYDPDIDIAVIRVSHAALKGHDTSAFATLTSRIPAPETCGRATRSTPSAIPWAWGWQSAPASSAPRSGMWSGTPCPAS